MNLRLIPELKPKKKKTWDWWKKKDTNHQQKPQDDSGAEGLEKTSSS